MPNVTALVVWRSIRNNAYNPRRSWDAHRVRRVHPTVPRRHDNGGQQNEPGNCHQLYQQEQAMTRRKLKRTDGLSRHRRVCEPREDGRIRARASTDESNVRTNSLWKPNNDCSAYAQAAWRHAKQKKLWAWNVRLAAKRKAPLEARNGINERYVRLPSCVGP